MFKLLVRDRVRTDMWIETHSGNNYDDIIVLGDRQSDRQEGQGVTYDYIIVEVKKSHHSYKSKDAQ